MSSTPEIPEKLKQAIEDDDLVVFVGAGFSSVLDFPSWDGLVEEILNALSKTDSGYKDFLPLLKSGMMDAIQVLDKAEKYKGDVLDVLEQTFCLDEDKKSKLDENEQFNAVWKLSSKVITTNYDQALETAGGLLGSPDVVTHAVENGIKNLSKKSRYLFKIHGDYADSKNCILFTSDYDRLYGVESSPTFELKTLIAHKRILFVGFSMADPFISQLFSQVKEMYGDLKGNQHFIITTGSNGFSKYGVANINIGGYDELPDYLNRLVQLKPDAANSSPIKQTLDNENNAPRAALLMANPITENYDYSTELQAFKKFKGRLDIFHLSEDALNELDGYDYIFLLSKQIKGKVVIEGEYLEKRTIDLKGIEDAVGNTDTKAMFLFLDSPLEQVFSNEFTLPIVVYPQLSKNKIGSVLFRAFKKGCQLCPIDGYQVINQTLFRLSGLQGQHSEGRKKTTLPSEIDSKEAANFVGRETDLRYITREIIELQHEEGILTIKGSGGIGKTKTVKKVAISLAERNYFPGGIHFIDCEFLTGYKLFEFRLFSPFHLEQSKDARGYLREYPPQENPLIIFDNFETLLHTKDHEQIVELLNFICDYATVVVTSRELLDLPWEKSYELRRMNTDEAEALFLQGMGKHRLSVDDRKVLREEVVEALLDNNPLAINLITQNIPSGKDISVLKNELEDDFFKKVRDEDLAVFDEYSDVNIERKRSIYGSIYYSYKQLSPQESMAFELLSLFPDGIDLEALKVIAEHRQQKLKKGEHIHRLAITDKVIRDLEKKSMLEGSGNVIKLQSIMGKFAEQKLRQRDDISSLYRNAFRYNRVILERIDEIDIKKPHLSDKIFSAQQNNFLKSIDYLGEFDCDSDEIVEYFDGLSTHYISISASRQLIDVIKGYQDRFVGDARLLFDSVLIYLNYYDGLFDEAYEQLKREFPLESLGQYDISIRTVRLAVATMMHVYDMEGYELSSLAFEKDRKGVFRAFPRELFCIGEYTHRLLGSKPADLFSFECLNNLGLLQSNTLDVYLNELHDSSHLDRMSIYYIKAKMGCVPVDEINKLVEVNPYTTGLKQLIFAFNETNKTVAKTFYLAALDNLKHIKYYYVEALFFFAKFLKKFEDPLYDEIFQQGLGLANTHYYRFLIYQFEGLKIPKSKPYNSKDYPLPDNANFDDYIAYLIRESEMR